MDYTYKLDIEIFNLKNMKKELRDIHDFQENDRV